MTRSIFPLLAALSALPSACVRRPCLCEQACKAADDGCEDGPAADPKKFRDDRPDLPPGVACLSDPLAMKASDFRISSPFRDPEHCWAPGWHGAVDIPAEAGTPVVAPAAGIVVKVGQEHGDAWYVVVVFGVFWEYTVVHLREIAVKEGEEARTGQVLGWSGGEVGAPGSGPYTTGPHLHFSMRYGGAFVDPEKYLCRTYPHSAGKMTCPKKPARCRKTP